MTNLQKAKVVRKTFKLLLVDIKTEARCGCSKSASNIIDYMVMENSILRDLGYMIGDNGKIVEFKPDWPEMISLNINR